MSEFSYINFIRRSPVSNKATILGPGDDAGVVKISSGTYVLLAADTLVEGVHFYSDTPLDLVGRKALAVNLSDLAAMGGAENISALVCVSFPQNISGEGPDLLYQGLSDLARLFDVAIIGGDTTSGSQELVISVSVSGTIDPKYLVKRSGAQMGDHIWVTGYLGNSLASEKHLRFLPRLPEAAALTREFKLSAMIDISDGLLNDLQHILRESGGLSATLSREAIPLSPSMVSGDLEKSLEQACCDGEDFELLFTLSPSESARLEASSLAKNPQMPLTRIGEIHPGHSYEPRLCWLENAQVIKFENYGYEHRFGHQNANKSLKRT